ncbi:hypothetical protein NCCP2716_13530 [Sporosarcina sp. NCCP-2716]|uniref:hypothetical protein n=1 Tax=Sporosarcina sp. NCCP-2716 TaxID=2943679 RepID=UPI00203E2453|nr:hypothetical protein [Sporosarcina sp. NCCP-2716]GKV68855.1 hypothetical protein NCCP2716_13530 [Sporosarcina sp. NCCP-2716]
MKKLYIIAAVLLLLLLLPFVIWTVKPEKELSIAVIDKTVSDDTYREHLGMTWLLNYLKVKTADGKPYREKHDYYGVIPPEKGKGKPDVRPLPESYEGTDVIYIADTYGVFEDDVSKDDSDRSGARSAAIYGGLSEAEWNAIEKRTSAKEPSLLIAEYNTFASPTTDEVRKQVTKHLGVEWQGWTARYFEELDVNKNKEIPQWIVDEHSKEWMYSGGGFLLVNDLDGSYLVLEDGKHVKEGSVQMTLTKQGERRLKTQGSHDYSYWFDIITPRPGAEVLADYDWSLTEDGRRLLAEEGIPSEFAAVVQKIEGAAESLYFAGDYNDVPSVPKVYQMEGLPQLYKGLYAFSDQSFYWSAYVPMMAGALGGFGKQEEKQEAAAPAGDLDLQARISGDKMEVLDNGNWKPITVKGVNIGMGKPGVFPGEAAITEGEYYRWFEAIGDMNANTIRVYTLHPPAFYRALKSYNESHDQPIHVMHGVWINEEKLVESLDAFEKGNLQDFRDEMTRLVDVVHGNADVEERPGHASGVYDADISRWVSAWMIGVEWYPLMVEGTNEKHTGIGEYDGTYFKTEQAEPFEYWLAEQMDYLVKHEVENYRAIRPMSFTNWVTTDLLDHPADSSDSKDLVSVDPNKIYVKGEMEKAGQFASYHVYPYYPDFLNYEKRYREFIDFRGDKNNYAAYLKDLHAAHRLPVLIAEFGIPASRGKTHENPFGWNQGFMSEKQQGDVLTRLYEDILHEGMMGGLVFTWQDEWFKRTWNTMDYDDPNRRPFWSNAQTNEQQFGLLSFDRLKIKVDGETDDWEAKPLYEKDSGNMNKLCVDHDERYLYVRLDMDGLKDGAYPVITLDTVPGQGNSTIDGITGAEFSDGLEFTAKLDGKDARLLIDPYYDYYHYLYGKELGLIEDVERKNDSGKFIPIEYALNKPYLIPNENRTIPYSSYETGKLKEGNGNPEADDYDSLTDFAIRDGRLELRIPWLLIQSRDPSQKEFIGNLAKDGDRASVKIDDIGIGALIVGRDGSVLDSFPERNGTKVGSQKRYTWDNWDQPQYEERLKQSYYILQKTFEDE